MQEDSVWNFGLIEVEIHMEHSDIRRRLPCGLDISFTSTTAECRQRFSTSKMHIRPPVA